MPPIEIEKSQTGRWDLRIPGFGIPSAEEVARIL
jgi:hypothetical protein